MNTITIDRKTTSVENSLSTLISSTMKEVLFFTKMFVAMAGFTLVLVSAWI